MILYDAVPSKFECQDYHVKLTWYSTSHDFYLLESSLVHLNANAARIHALALFNIPDSEIL
jgi:hypothetical protein